MDLLKYIEPILIPFRSSEFNVPCGVDSLHLITVPMDEPQLCITPNTHTDGAAINEIMCLEGIELIKRSEGYFYEAYRCPAGVWTIGYGTTIYPNGMKVKKGDVATPAHARAWLRNEIEHKMNRLNQFLDDRSIIDLNINERSALGSFAYNLGMGPIITEGRTMHEALLSGNKQRIANAFLIYNKARVGRLRRLKELRGLTLRRQAERRLFLLGVDS